MTFEGFSTGQKPTPQAETKIPGLINNGIAFGLALPVILMLLCILKELLLNLHPTCVTNDRTWWMCTWKNEVSLWDKCQSKDSEKYMDVNISFIFRWASIYKKKHVWATKWADYYTQSNKQHGCKQIVCRHCVAFRERARGGQINPQPIQLLRSIKMYFKMPRMGLNGGKVWAPCHSEKVMHLSESYIYNYIFLSKEQKAHVNRHPESQNSVWLHLNVRDRSEMST